MTGSVFSSGSQTWSKGQGQEKSALGGVRIFLPSTLMTANRDENGEPLSHPETHVPTHKVRWADDVTSNSEFL